MHKTNHHANAHLEQLFWDIMFLGLSFGIAYVISSQLTVMNPVGEYLWMLVIYIPFWCALMALEGMYDKTTFYYIDRILRDIIFASVLSVLGLIAMLFFVKELGVSRLFICILVLLTVIVMFSERCVFRALFKRSGATRKAPRIVLVCSRDTFVTVMKYLAKTQMEYNIVGVVQIGGAKISKVPNLGPLVGLGRILHQEVIDEVLFSIPEKYDYDWRRYVQICEQMGITTRIIINYGDLSLYHVHVSMLGTLPVLTMHAVSLNPVQQFVKRSIDIVGSLVGIFITTAIAVFVIPAIKLDSPGPVIFKQQRVGLNGRIFNMYKFRTMCVDAETMKKDLTTFNEHNGDLMFKIKDDPRITNIGAFLRRTSIDEMPQFVNVLKGEMSLVGTRPHTVEEYRLYNYEHMRRLSIKPGITGMWQINGRSSITDFDEVLALDTKYIDNWSIWMDLSIILTTVVVIFRTNSAY